MAVLVGQEHDRGCLRDLDIQIPDAGRNANVSGEWGLGQLSGSHRSLNFADAGDPRIQVFEAWLSWLSFWVVSSASGLPVRVGGGEVTLQFQLAELVCGAVLSEDPVLEMGFG